MALEHAEPVCGPSPAAADHAEPVSGEREHSYLTSEETLLVSRAREGNQRALRQLYETHQQQVRGHLFRLIGPDPDIDDLVQTVFARAFMALDGFKANSTISTWLYRITANTTHNLLRQRFRRDRVKTALHWFNVSRGSHVAAGRVEARDEAQRVLQMLHPDLREIFVLYHYEGLTLQEISAIVDRPISTVGDRLTRARKKLRELVAVH